jgi:hypothetical protein
MTILIADAVISIAVQLSDAIHTLAGGLAFALPALAFLALTKLVLSRARTATTQAESPTAPPASGPDLSDQPRPQIPETAAAAPVTVHVPGDLTPVPSGQLLASARMTAFAHRQQTGEPITASELATRLSVPPALAESLLENIDGTPPPVTTVNGTVMNGSRP